MHSRVLNENRITIDGHSGIKAELFSFFIDLGLVESGSLGRRLVLNESLFGFFIHWRDLKI